jgi:transcriptional regulator with XRE-family HTH domain
MSEPTSNPTNDLVAKIARLAEEKGWNQEDFARICAINRQTARQILQPTGERTLRNSTIANIARGLSLSVHELRALPLDHLLARIRNRPTPNSDERLHRLFELATHPQLRAWMERNPERAHNLTPDEVEELLALQTGDTFTSVGVEGIVERIERRRSLMEQIRAIASTEYLDLLEQLIGLIYDRIQPSRDRI